MKACVIIPSYNTGPILKETIICALEQWHDVFVVIDGSSDGSDTGLEALEVKADQHLRVHRLPINKGKGSAFFAGTNLALEEGFTHALAMDADGQHPADHIRRFMEVGANYPQALILGKPVFDQSAPSIRIKGRKISNWWANFSTGWWGIHDSLFGMRLYPLSPLRETFRSTLFARRFDFDPEVAIRLCWKGTPVINLDTPVRYLSEDEGGVSQFKYVRDNALLTFMYIRLVTGFLFRSPILLIRKFSGGNPLKSIHPQTHPNA